MEWIIILAIAAYLMIRFGRRNVNKDDNSSYESSNDIHTYQRKPCESSNENYTHQIDPYEFVDGYRNFPIKGIYYRNLSEKDIRDFDGVAVAEDNNPYDEFAVSIYNERGVHVGYAPGHYFSLHEYIRKQGGRVRAFGTIWKEEGQFYGRVNIQFNPNHFGDDIPEEDRIYKKPNLKSYSLELSKPVHKGKFRGYAELGDPFNFLIYNEEKELIGQVSNEEYLYNTVKKYNDGKVEVWGNIVGIDECFGNIVYIPARCSKNKIDKSRTEFENDNKQ